MLLSLLLLLLLQSEEEEEKKVDMEDRVEAMDKTESGDDGGGSGGGDGGVVLLRLDSVNGRDNEGKIEASLLHRSISSMCRVAASLRR